MGSCSSCSLWSHTVVQRIVAVRSVFRRGEVAATSTVLGLNMRCMAMLRLLQLAVSFNLGLPAHLYAPDSLSGLYHDHWIVLGLPHTSVISELCVMASL